MQLGVAHALLVCRGAAPDYAVGVSAGAINAAALAEILQAGDKLPPEAQLAARIEKLRQFLNAYREIPQNLLDAILPDTFEVNDNQPLTPLELPIHFVQERADRKKANVSKAGIARLLNDVWKVRLTVGTATRIIRRVLGLAEAAAEPRALPKLYLRCRAGIGILALGWRHPTQLAPLFWDVVRAVAGPGPTPVRRSTGQRIFRWQFIHDLAATFRFLIETLAFFPAWLVALITLLFLPTTARRRLVDRVLQYFSIADGLANTDVLKQQLVECFDPYYYGTTDISQVLNTALAYRNDPAPGSGAPRTLGEYATRKPSITVAPIAADVANGSLEVLPGPTAIVTALLAATATVPLFPAVRIEALKKLYIDGMNVSNEALGPLLDYLRDHPPPPGTTIVDLYSVSPLPVTTSSLQSHKTTFSGIMDVVARALQLRRFRDATLEQRLTELYSKVLPTGQACTPIEGRTYIRTALFPLEPDQPINVNERILKCPSTDALTTLLYETVADGCRTALEGMVPDAIREAVKKERADAENEANGTDHVACFSAMRVRLGPKDHTLPGSEQQPGPGLPEICKHCALTRPLKAATEGEPATATQGMPDSDLPTTAASKKPTSPPTPPLDPAKQQLRVRANHGTWPAWPQEHERRRPTPGLPMPEPKATYTFDKRWPRDADKQRPLISLLFGGGVFRGVFHMGVANALNELGVKPDLVAGSSVGSIIAAMIAQMFTEPTPGARSLQITRLAATFLAMDRLILTDRLADFIRRFTLRAANTDFAPRDLDLLLRRYDRDSEDRFQRRWRRVEAGLERLFYLTSFELQDLIKAARDRVAGNTSKLLDAAVQGFLDRSGIGREALGAEPLALLINNHVIDRLCQGRGKGSEVFDSFLETGIYFLATTTNLHKGSLEILGAPYDQGPQASLLYGLLASSAFPGVFRPRESWEIFPLATTTDQYIDGGTIDNLPLDAVARFLDRASPQHIARRPTVNKLPVPHLLFTASLERDVNSLTATDDLQYSCLRLRARAATFTHNRKVDAYARVQSDLRAIYTNTSRRPDEWMPVDLHVLAVKPQWLCNTFGFHPMLGFRRRKQAQSIAHGCASTLAEFAAQNPSWVDGWGIGEAVGSFDRSTLPKAGDTLLRPQKAGKKTGECWFRKGIPCPFSRQAVAQLPTEKPLPTKTVTEIDKIYQICGEASTHQPYEE